jgi:hypothetical protein
MLPEHEKQVYHEFGEFPKEVIDHTPRLMPDDYCSKYDIHHLVTNGPIGMDPCMTFE